MKIPERSIKKAPVAARRGRRRTRFGAKGKTQKCKTQRARARITWATQKERANLVYALKIRVPNDGYLKIGMYGGFNLN